MILIDWSRLSRTIMLVRLK